eukprot:255219_1
MTNARETGELTECMKLLNTVQGKPEAEPFVVPVDWKNLNLPDYPQIIKHPMDLGTIESNLSRGVYKNAFEFAKDVRLVWSNAKTYNQEGSGIYLVAQNLETLFNKRFEKIKKAEVKKRESTQEERLRFTELVKQLSVDELGVIVEMVEKQCPNALQEVKGSSPEGGGDDLEIEVFQIDGDCLAELITFSDDCVKKSGEKKA